VTEPKQATQQSVEFHVIAKLVLILTLMTPVVIDRLVICVPCPVDIAKQFRSMVPRPSEFVGDFLEVLPVTRRKDFANLASLTVRLDHFADPVRQL